MVVTGHYCKKKSKVCDRATSLGECRHSACIDNYTQTITISSASTSIGRVCSICDNAFEIYSIRDERRICPECKKRLHSLLYEKD